ncbi:MAG: acylneuraminate cytidylyltransferase family protein [Candidatus Brocadiales bacterium]|nr:acylneuraminate cytidylyltransferase family protein [Candidatus Brocadiales bacterium]
MLNVLGVILARGGSKGVPGKNIKPLAGIPLIAYTIKTALKSKYLTRTIISTDDEEIADLSRSYGGEVPFLRPAELATDNANAIPVIQHALTTLEKTGDSIEYDVVMMLQPTSPFRTEQDIDGAIKLLDRTKADSVISVVDVDSHHPARMKYLEGDELIDPLFAETYENQPRQELVPMYIRNGAIYATRKIILLNGSFKGLDCRAWIMPRERSLNIDTEMDFKYAEWLISERFV